MSVRPSANPLSDRERTRPAPFLADSLRVSMMRPHAMRSLLCSAQVLRSASASQSRLSGQPRTGPSRSRSAPASLSPRTLIAPRRWLTPPCPSLASALPLSQTRACATTFRAYRGSWLVDGTFLQSMGSWRPLDHAVVAQDLDRSLQPAQG